MFPEPLLQRARKVVHLAREHQVGLATAESCTGGLVAGCLTEVPGASDVVHGGVVAYTLEAKARLLGLDPPLLQDGGVGDEVTAAMAEAVRARTGAGVAVAVTGWAGEGPSVPRGEAGRVVVALARGEGSAEVGGHRFRGGRTEVRLKAVHAVLGRLEAGLRHRDG